MTLNPILASINPRTRLQQVSTGQDIGEKSKNVYKETAARIRITDLIYKWILPVFFFSVFAKYLFTEVFNEVKKA